MKFRTPFNYEPDKGTVFTEESMVDASGYMTIQEIIQRFMAGQYIPGLQTTVEYDYSGDELNVEEELNMPSLSGDYSDISEALNAQNHAQSGVNSNSDTSKPEPVKAVKDQNLNHESPQDGTLSGSSENVPEVKPHAAARPDESR